MKQIPVKDNPGLVRDLSTGAICNINSSEISLAKKRKQNEIQEKQRQLKLENDIDELKNQFGEIKNIINKLIEKM